MSDLLESIKRESKEIQKEVLRRALINLYAGSLYKTAKHLLSYKDMTWHTHGKMIEALEAPTKRKLIVMPRGTFKSSIAVVAYPIWKLLFHNNDARFLIDSEKYENSKNFIREIKAHLVSDPVAQLFGDMTTRNWGEGEVTVSLRKKNLKEASLTASGIGAGKTGQHYDEIICDDLNTEENSQNEEQRKKTLRHYRMNLAILEPEGTMSIIGTRYAVDDVIGSILANEVGPGLLGAG